MEMRTIWQTPALGNQNAMFAMKMDTNPLNVLEIKISQTQVNLQHKQNNQ